MGADDPSVYDSIYKVFSPFTGNMTQMKKTVISNIWVRNLTELYMNRFKWEGLPDEVDERFLEMTLYMQGFGVFFMNPAFDKYMFLRGTWTNEPDYQDNPSYVTAVGNNMIPEIQLTTNEKFATDELPLCVPIWANRLRVPDQDTILFFAQRLTEIEMSTDQTIINSRNPVILFADKQGRDQLSLTNIYRSIQEGQLNIGAVSTDVGESIDSKIKALETGVKIEDAAILDDVRNDTLQLFCTFMGINNSPIDKKERLVSAEVGSNDSLIGQFRNIALNTRQQACYEINRVYGLNLSCEWREEEVDPSEIRESEDNENDSEEPHV